MGQAKRIRHHRKVPSKIMTITNKPQLQVAKELMKTHLMSLSILLQKKKQSELKMTFKKIKFSC